ncbi:unnamed protein product [Darwinula stevensoni]|uniref:Uncharacterized protein n=1 Tax=Darwinula stevensoni TaxID=69355 RepID=A0A7R8X092_9CRUS|nr:unnamed protein product [Darwinula stevensoni]CAG0881433.1 unnamed protein product [Darwinula stevensoni]
MESMLNHLEGSYEEAIAAWKCRSLQKAEDSFSALRTMKVYPVPIDTPWCHLEHPTPFSDPSTLLNALRAWATHKGLRHVFLFTDEENEVLWKGSLLPELMQSEDLGFTYFPLTDSSQFPWEKMEKEENVLLAVSMNETSLEGFFHMMNVKPSFPPAVTLERKNMLRVMLKILYISQVGEWGRFRHRRHWSFLIPRRLLEDEASSFFEHFRADSDIVLISDLEKQTEPLSGRALAIVQNRDYRSDGVLFYQVNANQRLQEIGRWTNGKLDLQDKKSRIALNFQGARLRVVTINAPPFIYVWNDTVENRYEGYLIDVLNTLAENLNFTFTLTVVKDGKYGAVEPSGSWNGIVGEVMRGEAHIGLANLGQSKERASVVDFPSVDISYEYAGIMLRTTEEDPKEKMLLFMRPFAKEVWLAIFGNILLFAMALALVSLFVPSSSLSSSNTRDEPHPFRFENALWFTFGAYAQQGHPRVPHQLSNRVLFGVFWVSAVILYASYGATLASHFAVAFVRPPFNSLEELLDSDYKFGFTPGSVYVQAFKQSELPLHKRTYDRWETFKEDVRAVPREKATSMVAKGGFAFITDVSLASYLTMERCDLTILKQNYMKMSNGIILQKDSEYTYAISTSLRSMKEGGILSKLRMKWWPQSKCFQDNTDYRQIGLLEVSSAFLIVSTGCLCSFLIICGERLYHAHQVLHM